MLRCESLLGLDQATCSRVLNKNYKLLVSMAPLSNEIRPISSCTPQVPRCCRGRRTGGGGPYVVCSDAPSIITHFIDVCAFALFVCGRSCAPKCFGPVCVDAFGGAPPASCPRQQNYTKREGMRDGELFLCLDTGQHSSRAEREVELLSCHSRYSLSSKP